VFKLSESESFAVAFGVPQIIGEGNKMFLAHGLFSCVCLATVSTQNAANLHARL
jgi:hypothetical protein